MLGLLVEEKGIEKCASLKYVFSGGEVLSSQVQEDSLVGHPLLYIIRTVPPKRP